MSTTVLILILKLNLKFVVICKNAEFEFQYIRINTKEKSSNITNIALHTCTLHCHFIRKKDLQLNCHCESFGILLMLPSDGLQNSSF